MRTIKFFLIFKNVKKSRPQNLKISIFSPLSPPQKNQPV